jgi:hypothetical protein
MGVIRSGILSKVSGKVAGVVGASWKDVAYLRAWVKPANPNTAAQQAQRSKFSYIVGIAKLCVGQVFNAYTDKFIKSMSGFNFFIKRNIDFVEDPPLWDSFKYTEGPLSSPLLTSATYSAGDVVFNWTENLGNNGLSTDKVFGLCLNTEDGVMHFASAEVDRSAETFTIVVPDVADPTSLKCAIWAGQYIGTVLDMISNSSNVTGEAL